MKKLIALVLTLCLALTCATALAELTVVQETYTPLLKTNPRAVVVGHIFAEVTNSGDENVAFTSGRFGVLSADGKELDSFRVKSCCPSVLAPGDTGYVFYYDRVDDAVDVQDVPGYTLTINGKTSKEAASVRLLTTSATAEKAQEGAGTVYRAKFTVTNNTDKTVYHPAVAFGFYDAEGKLIYCDDVSVSNLGIPAGQTVEFSVTTADKFFVEAWDAAGVAPATVKAFAYGE